MTTAASAAGPWTAVALTLFPEMFPGPLGHSLAGRALENGLWRLEAHDSRAFATDVTQVSKRGVPEGRTSSMARSAPSGA